MSPTDIVYLVVILPAVVVVEMLFPDWSRIRCECGRSMLPHFRKRHEGHRFLIFRALLGTTLAIINIATAHPFGAILWAAHSAYRWWVVKMHGKGRRKWPEKVAGMVRINEHGRLSVER